MHPEIKIQYGGGRNQAKGNLFLKVPRKRERKTPRNKLEEQKVKEGREKGKDTN